MVRNPESRGTLSRTNPSKSEKVIALRYLPRAVGPEIGEEDTVSIVDGPDGLSVFDDYRGDDEFVRLAPGVGRTNSRHGVRGCLTLSEHDRIVPLLYPLPPLVSIHPEKAPLKACYSSRTEFSEEGDQLFHIARPARGRGISSVKKGVEEEAFDPIFVSGPKRREDMFDVAVHSPIGQ